jgi:type I restriction enzyme S subunit
MRELWKQVKLGDVATIASSGVDKHISPGEVAVRLCNYLNVYRQRRLTRDTHFSSGTATPAEIARFTLAKGDVLITKDSETPDDIGVPSVVVDDLIGVICGYHLALIRPAHDLASHFLLHYLQSDAAKRHFLRTASGLTRFGLGIRAISSLAVSLPSSGEQSAIASILDAVDTVLECTRTVNDRAKDLDHSLLHELLERGLSPRRSGRQKYLSHWSVKRVDQVAEVGSGVTLGKDVSGYKSIELPYLRVANVQDGHLNLSTIKTVRVRVDEVDSYRLETGDVLMTEGGDIDKLGRGTIWESQIENCLHQNHIFRIRADRALLEPDFFSLVVESDIAKRYFNRVAKRTTNLASTNKTQVRAFQFPVPPTTEEQREIVAIMKASKRTLAGLSAKLTALRQLKISLLHDLLIGGVGVKNPAEAAAA